jgi:hypothetical protein
VEVSVTVCPGTGEAGDWPTDAVGGAWTVTRRSAVSVFPRLSVTRRPTVYVPAAGNDLAAAVAVPSSNAPSSSRSHACDAIVAPGPAVDVEARVTACPGTGEAGDWPIDAAGGACTLTCLLAVAALPRLSVTRSRTVKAPVVANDLFADAAVPSSNAPSLSRSHACDAIVDAASPGVEVELKVTAWLGTGASSDCAIEATGGAYTVTVLVSMS